MRSTRVGLVAAVCVIGLRLFAADYFVSPSGNNNNTGLSGAPWLTLQKAADTVAAGDTVTVEDGTYSGFTIKKRNGTSANRIVFKARNKWGAVINGPQNPGGTGDAARHNIAILSASYITIDGFVSTLAPFAGIAVRSFDGVADGSDTRDNIIQNCHCHTNGGAGGGSHDGIFSGFALNIIIQDNDVHNNAEHGIYVSNSADNPIVRRNKVYNNSVNGIQLNADLNTSAIIGTADGLISNWLIEDNVIYGNQGAAGINLDGDIFGICRNNLLYNNAKAGITLYAIDGAEASHDNLIVNNTIYNPSGTRGAIIIDDNANNNVIFNNILYSTGTGFSAVGLEIRDATGTVHDYNFISSYLGASASANETAPAASTLFVDIAGADFHLKSGSTAIDSGIASLSSKNAPTKDIDNNARPQGVAYDRGCYERVNAVPNNPPTVATAAQATPSPVTATTTSLSVLGADDGGEGSLIYTWSSTGPTSVSFSANGTNAAKSSTATFSAAGNYSFTATIRDAGNLTITSVVNVTVNQTAATVNVTPPTASVATGGTQTFTASVSDQFGAAISNPSINWSVGGGGAIDANGAFTAGGTPGGPFTITASSGNATGTASVSVTGGSAGNAITSGPTATPNPAITGQVVSFSCAANGTAPITWLWDFNDGSTATGESVTHVFPAAGDFTITVSATDAQNNVAVATLILQVNAGGGGGTPPTDTDGDGVSDEQENGAGINPNDPNSKPGGSSDFDGDGLTDDFDSDADGDGADNSSELAAGTNPYDANSVTKLAMTVLKLQGTAQFKAPGRDMCAVSGIIPAVQATLEPAGKLVSIDVGGVKASFTLDQKGRSKTASGSLQLKLKGKRNKATKKFEFLGGDVPFKVLLKNGNFAPNWTDEGVNASMTLKKVPVPFVVDLHFNGSVYTATSSTLYSAKAGVNGKFKK